MANNFSVITAQAVKDITDKNPHEIYDIVKTAYIRHGEGKAHNPPSYFLSFPDKPKSRIIALPSLITENPRIAGIKWISSNPDNILMTRSLKRASAVIILNDYNTGYPIACIEGGIISALRTVYSAVVIGELLSKVKTSKSSIGIVGAGNISFQFIKAVLREKWHIDNVLIYDLNQESAIKFKDETHAYCKSLQDNCVDKDVECLVQKDLEELITNSDILFLSTTSKEPYIKKNNLFKHKPLVLNISLRDLAPEILLVSNNVVDDIDHVLNANTSPHLAYQTSGDKNFINCNAYELINGYKNFDSNKPTVFSPMGMGILDLMLANYIYEKSQTQNLDIKINNFFE
jgi:ornithine cyclodeaminase